MQARVAVRLIVLDFLITPQLALWKTDTGKEAWAYEATRMDWIPWAKGKPISRVLTDIYSISPPYRFDRMYRVALCQERSTPQDPNGDSHG